MLSREHAHAILVNWGRWSRSGGLPDLGYGQQPMFAMYRAPRQDAPKARVPVIEADAEAAERAVQAILAEGEHLHKLLVGWYVYKLTAHELQQELSCSRATVYRWRDEALDFFTRLYQGKVKK